MAAAPAKRPPPPTPPTQEARRTAAARLAGSRLAVARLPPVRRTRYGLTRYFDPAGRLLPEAIVLLIRRVWWAGDDLAEVRRTPDCWRCKVTPLLLWYAPARWPAWWPAGTWVDVGDRLQACTDGGALWVRRSLL
jgi:hypothetical protein